MADKFYITTTLPYANAGPHLGHALEFVVSDAIARWQRLLDKEVYFLSGTDEHGAKIARAAGASGKEIKEFVDENSSLFRELIKVFDISTDDFIRTSDRKRHFPGVEKMWKKFESSGDIYKKKYKGLYCVGHEAFVTQKDLVNGLCADHGRTPETIEEENYFFRLSKYSDSIRQAIISDEFKIYPEARKNEILSFLDQGLQDLSFSRPAKDIAWGIAVPGDPTQTIYVWADALSNYITALGFGSEDPAKFKKFWPADLQVCGKDNLRFHAAIWPGMLLSADLPLPKVLLVHGFVTSGGRKMSKTLGNIADPLDIAQRYGSEALRYYLLSEIPDFEDGDFNEERFREVYNSRLANGLGNFISRVAAMIKNYFPDGLSKPPQESLNGVSMKKQSVQDFINQACRHIQESMAKYELKSAIDGIWRILQMFDGYVQTYEPFKLIKTDPKKAEAALWNLAYGALSAAWMLKPFMPGTSEKIFEIFGIDPSSEEEWLKVKITLGGPLFPRKE
jgi:methionyl-tRNA synthetase